MFNGRKASLLVLHKIKLPRAVITERRPSTTTSTSGCRGREFGYACEMTADINLIGSSATTEGILFGSNSSSRSRGILNNNAAVTALLSEDSLLATRLPPRTRRWARILVALGITLVALTYHTGRTSTTSLQQLLLAESVTAKIDHSNKTASDGISTNSTINPTNVTSRLRTTVNTAVKKSNETPPVLGDNCTNSTNSTGNNDAEALALLSSKAEAALRSLKTEVFETDVSDSESVLQYGFPVSWDACTLPMVSNSSTRQQPLQVAVLGGSSTARTPFQCDEQYGRLAGRFTNMLQRELAQDLGTAEQLFRIVNLAHGATDTFWSSLVLDEVVDVNHTDVLVWEYAINDALGGGTGYPPRTDDKMRRMLDLWLWRVIQLFRIRKSARPPPIILVYLWDSGPASSLTGVGQSAFRAQESVVDYYRELGLQISVINVGGAVNGTVIKTGKGQLLDDYHHPGCEGAHLISGMLRHVLLTDIVACNERGGWKQGAVTSDQLVSKSIQPMTKPSTEIDVALMNALFGQGEIGSIMAWLPKKGKSLLTIGSSDNTTTEALNGAKTSLSRQDRKNAYALAVCPETTSFVLEEPSLEWLGLGFGGGSYAKHPFSGKKRITINGQRVAADDQLPSNRTLRVDLDEHQRDGVVFTSFVDQWIRVLDVVPRSSHYKLDICNDANELSRCPFHNATSVSMACDMWYDQQRSSTGVLL